MKLIDHPWTVLKRSATTWVTLAVNTIAAHALVFLAVLPFAPIYVQLPLAVLIAIVASSPTWLARVAKQPRMEAKLEEKAGAKPDC